MNALLKDLPQTALTAEQEQSALAEGNTELIVLHALPPAFTYIKRLCHGRIEDGEILSVCYAALAKAIRNYKPSQQRFLSYSRVYLRGELSAAWREKDLVRNAAKHETTIEPDITPLPIISESVEPGYDQIHYKEMWAKIEPLIRRLTPKEIAVLELRYKAGLNFREAGVRLGGLSRERIRQIEAKALRKIRGMLPKGLA